MASRNRLGAVITALALALAACGDDDSDSGDSATPATTSAAPTASEAKDYTCGDFADDATKNTYLVTEVSKGGNDTADHASVAVNDVCRTHAANYKPYDDAVKALRSGEYK
jgi:hypothetical protein